MKYFQEIVAFNERTVKDTLIGKMRLGSKLQEAFRFIVDKVPAHEPMDLNKVDWLKTKNYNWCVIQKDNVTLIIRHYGNHFTIFTKRFTEHDMGEHTYKEYRYSGFTYFSETEHLSDEESDARCDDNFVDLNNSLTRLIEIVAENGVHTIWNDLSFVRPKHVEAKVMFDGDEIYSFDNFIFGCDEIFHLAFMLFAENEIVEKVKEFEGKEGQMLNSRYKIDYVRSEVDKEYYHSTGIGLIDTLSEKESKSFQDVYSLGRWYYEDMYFGNIKKNIEKFLFTSHDKVFAETFNKDIMIMAQFTNPYIKMMHELFIAEGNDIDIKVFVSFLPKNFMEFLEMSCRVNLTKL